MMREVAMEKKGLSPSKADSTQTQTSGLPSPFRFSRIAYAIKVGSHIFLLFTFLLFYISAAFYFDSSGKWARLAGLPAPTTPHNCIMSYTRPIFKPIPFCSPSNTRGAVIETVTCNATRVASTSHHAGGADGLGDEDDTARNASTPLGGDDPVNALGGATTAEGLLGFQLFSFFEGGYDTGRKFMGVEGTEPFRDVPLLIVPGNAGSYYDARGLASAVSLGNVRRSCNFARRFSKLNSFSENVTEDGVMGLFSERAGAGQGSPFAGTAPLSYRDPTPSLLGVQPFAAGFIEMAVVHNGFVLMRAAQHVRDSILYLRRSFLEQHMAGPGPRESRDGRGDATALRRVAVQHALSKMVSDACTQGGTAGHVTTPAVSRAVCEDLFHSTEELYDVARNIASPRHVQMRPVLRAALLKRLSLEVSAVERTGLWVVGHSLGGTAARLGALLALARDPRSVAGIITLAGPNMAPPVFADLSTRQLFASMRSYYNSFCDGATEEERESNTACALGRGEVDRTNDEPHLTDEEVLLTPFGYTRESADPRIARLRCIASRQVKILSIGVGVFDKQVFYTGTSIEEEVMHSLGRGAGVIAPACPADITNTSTFPIPSLRLDRSSEQMLMSAFTTTHHGINYCAQFFNAYAYGLGELVRGTPMGRAFPTFGADVDAHSGAIAGSSASREARMRRLGAWLRERLHTEATRVATEDVSVVIPLMPPAISNGRGGSTVIAVVAFNRVVDEVSDVWVVLSSTGSRAPSFLAPIKVYRVPFRGGSNADGMEDTFEPFAETDAHASHGHSRHSAYHPTMVRTVAVFEVDAALMSGGGGEAIATPSALAERSVTMRLVVRVHDVFPADQGDAPLAARATWLVRSDGDENGWHFTASFAASRAMHGTSPITQLVADGHPIMATPLEEFVDMPRGVGGEGQLRTVREWALHHHHEGDDHTHIVFGGMQPAQRGVKATPLCTGSPQSAFSSCAIPFSPPITYYDERERVYLFIALAPLEPVSEEDRCVEWAVEASSDRTVKVCPSSSPSSVLAPLPPVARHMAILDLDVSWWLWFNSRFVIRFALMAQYYQLVMALFSGIFMVALMEVMTSALKTMGFIRANGLLATRQVENVQLGVIACGVLDVVLALFFGFDDGGAPVMSRPHHSPAAGLRTAIWSQVGTRDEWWGIPSTREEVLCRFLVQCAGAYSSYFIWQSMCAVGWFFGEYILKKSARRAAAARQLPAAPLRTTVRDSIKRCMPFLGGWLVLFLASLFYFSHMETPLILIGLYGIVTSIWLRRHGTRTCALVDAAALKQLALSSAADSAGQSRSGRDDPASDFASPVSSSASGYTVPHATLTRRVMPKDGLSTDTSPLLGDKSVPLTVSPQRGRDSQSAPRAAQYAQPTLLLPRSSLIVLLHLVFIMFFFTVRNDFMVAFTAAGQEQLYETRGAQGSSSIPKGRPEWSMRPTTPRTSIVPLLRMLVTGNSGHFTVRRDLKPAAGWEQDIGAWVLFLSYPLLLVGDYIAVTSIPSSAKGSGRSGRPFVGSALMWGLIALCVMGATLVAQEPLEACPRAVVGFIPSIVALWCARLKV